MKTILTLLVGLLLTRNSTGDLRAGKPITPQASVLAGGPADASAARVNAGPIPPQPKEKFIRNKYAE